jgi:hypothetical protein
MISFTNVSTVTRVLPRENPLATAGAVELSEGCGIGISRMGEELPRFSRCRIAEDPDDESFDGDEGDAEAMGTRLDGECRLGQRTEQAPPHLNGPNPENHEYS